MKLLNEVSALNGLLYEEKKKLCRSIIDIQKFKDAETRGRGERIQTRTETPPEFKPLNLLLSERRLSASPHLRVSFDECKGIEGVLQD